MVLRILIAEEKDAFRDQIVRALDGHDVVAAASAAEALRSLRHNAFPLVITGVEMGDTSGPTLMEQARTQNPGTLVVVTIDSSRASEAPRALRLGAYDFLVKPCEEDVLAAVLRRAIRQVTLAHENQALLASLKRNVEVLGLQNQRLQQLATRDGLTGLYHHRHFREALEAEMARSGRHGRVFSLLFADIDHFKKYNDTHGHLAGDRLVSALGTLMTSHSRRSNLVARYGGEEFVVLVPEADHASALVYAENIRSLVEGHPFDLCESPTEGRITLSMGVATYPEHGMEADALIKHADDALYRAKASGRNTVCGQVPAVSSHPL